MPGFPRSARGANGACVLVLLCIVYIELCTHAHRVQLTITCCNRSCLIHSNSASVCTQKKDDGVELDKRSLVLVSVSSSTGTTVIV